MSLTAPATRATGYIVLASDWNAIIADLVLGDSSQFDVVSTNALTTILTKTVPGGLLGSNGALRIGVVGDYVNNSGANRNFSIEIGAISPTWFSNVYTPIWGTSISAIGLTASHRAFSLDALLSNENATNVQRLAGYASLSDPAAGTVAGIGVLGTDVAYGTFGGSAALDSTANWTLLVKVQHSASNASLEFKGTAHVLYQP